MKENILNRLWNAIPNIFVQLKVVLLVVFVNHEHLNKVVKLVLPFHENIRQLQIGDGNQPQADRTHRQAELLVFSRLQWP